MTEQGRVMNFRAHNEAWIESKRRLGIDDVRALCVEKLREALQLAEQLRRDPVPLRPQRKKLPKVRKQFGPAA